MDNHQIKDAITLRLMRGKSGAVLLQLQRKGQATLIVGNACYQVTETEVHLTAGGKEVITASLDTLERLSHPQLYLLLDDKGDGSDGALRLVLLDENDNPIGGSEEALTGYGYALAKAKGTDRAFVVAFAICNGDSMFSSTFVATDWPVVKYVRTMTQLCKMEMGI